MARTFLVHTWRARWRSLALIAALAALAVGTSIAAAAGARRTTTTLDRFKDAAGAYDVFVAGEPEGGEPRAFLDLLDSPMVSDHNDLVYVFADDTYGFWFAPTSRAGDVVEQGVLLDGRRPDPEAPHEIALSQLAARESGLGVGDTLELPVIDQAQADALLQGQPPNAPAAVLELEVVGLVRGSADLVVGDDADALTLLTPAFLETYGDGSVGIGAPSHMVHLRRGAAGVDEFTDAVAEAYGGEHLPSINVGQGDASVSDAISVIASALALVAAAIGLASAAWLASAATRQMRLVERDVAVLRALGVTEQERGRLLAGTVAPALAVGLLLAPVVAVVLSPAFPVGLARDLDPDVGHHLDLAAVGLGLLTAAVVSGAALVPASGRLAASSAGVARAHGSAPALLGRMARALRPAASTGVRFALHSPRPAPASVPPALLGAWVAVLGLAAVAVIGASVQRVVDTPTRWGAGWDVAIGGLSDNDVPLTSDAIDREAVLAEDGVAAATVVLFDEQVTVNGAEAIALTFEPVKGELLPTAIDGRVPGASDEIALGRDTLEAAGAAIGDTVRVGSRSNASTDYRVVGVTAFPGISAPTPVATGAVLTDAGGDRLDLGVPNDSGDFGNYYLTLRWRPGADPAAVLAGLGLQDNLAQAPIRPPEVNGLEAVEQFPLLVALALAVLGGITAAHALLVTVRRRRAELGVLSALGFSPAQRRSVIVVQATTVAVVALAIGLPLGVVLGRLLWSGIAGSMGMATDARLPVGVLALGAAGLLLGLNLVAAWPARAARRLDVAGALRSE